ncbi:hypothetical protein GH714_015739 [Hevea brasiliensis]|uniref:Uncharacterized protein n=1 Tax=Hevea brasiliensis TaxID=3981 RepID=A0A6A6MA96_HEVBR|nr:hypothetical protein GH714_015739 [Hevea brasiliensis]
MAERGVIVDEKFCFQQEIDLTVRKTSVFFPGDGFVVYDPDGDVIFRFDSYGPDSQPKDELVLMDASGKCLLSLRRKKPSLHQRWEGFSGERKVNDDDHHQDPIFSVFRSSIIQTVQLSGGGFLVIRPGVDADLPWDFLVLDQISAMMIARGRPYLRE